MKRQRREEFFWGGEDGYSKEIIDYCFSSFNLCGQKSDGTGFLIYNWLSS